MDYDSQRIPYFPFLCEKKESPIRTCLLRWWRAATSSCAKRLECHWAPSHGHGVGPCWGLVGPCLNVGACRGMSANAQVSIGTSNTEGREVGETQGPGPFDGALRLGALGGALGVWDMVAPSRARRENLRLAEFASLLIPTPAIGIRHH